MANFTFKGNPQQTCGALPAVGQQAPAFCLVKTDLSEVTSAQLRGKKVVLNVFPSIDTGTCAQSVRTFHGHAASFPDAVVLCVSMDLPFAHKRFCAAEGIDRVHAVSAFRSAFGAEYGLTIDGGPLSGLFARAVFVLDEGGVVRHAQLVGELSQEPDYAAAAAALQ